MGLHLVVVVVYPLTEKNRIHGVFDPSRFFASVVDMPESLTFTRKGRVWQQQDREHTEVNQTATTRPVAQSDRIYSE